MAENGMFWHEKLDVYRLVLTFVSGAEDLPVDSSAPLAARVHLDRAGESVLENIVNGNSSRSPDRKRYLFAVAYGSTLECAGCLDLFCQKGLLPEAQWRDAKQVLQRVVRMLIGLIRSQAGGIREPEDDWGSSASEEVDIFFDHERLQVYRLALQFVAWADSVVDQHGLRRRRSKKLDELSTCIVLNIAEGNGRLDLSDRVPFIDTARGAALRAAVLIDLTVAKNELPAEQADTGKRMLGRISDMLLAMRGYCEDDNE